jgi:hypothetical protein
MPSQQTVSSPNNLRFEFPIAALKNLALALPGLRFFTLLLEINPHKLLLKY